MAASVTEIKFLNVPTTDGEGRARLWVTCATDGGGDTSYVVAPGNNTTNLSGSSVLRKIDTWHFENNTAQKAPQIVKTFNTTYGCDELTLTVAADDSYSGWVEGLVQV